jgi:hypothetical protein
VRRLVGIRRRQVALVVVVSLVVAVGGVGWSYVQALTDPGDASWQVRTVDWVREHGGAPLVNAAENWWYTHNAPGGSAPASGAVPSPATLDAPVSAPVSVTAHPPSGLPMLPGRKPLPGEGRWVPSPQRVGGVPALYTAYFRPDQSYPSQVAGVAWMDQTLVSTHLIAGTREPVIGTPPAQAQVPVDMQASLVAAFNSGWKMHDIFGGYYADGHAVIPLRDGAASLIIDAKGRVTVGRWGRDAQLNGQIVAVRQNLALIIDQGRTAPGLADNASGAWGSPKNQFQFTWRSGIGTDASGNLIYLAADRITLDGLARAMRAAGVVRGMELDIHPEMVTFNIFHHATGFSADVTGMKLLPDMQRPATRYLSPDQRDFFAVTLRAQADPAHSPN